MIEFLIVFASGLVSNVSAQEVPLWGRFETSVINSRSYTNPFTDVTLTATFIRPDKSRVPFWGFHDGDGNGGQAGSVWKLRFMPDQVGAWSYECSFSDGTSGKSGTFECVSGGAITIDLPEAEPAFKAEWLDPRTGARKVVAAMQGGAKCVVSCPDERDWVLHLAVEE